MLETQKTAYDFQLSNCWDKTVLLTVQDLAASAQKPGRGHPRGTRAAQRGQAARSWAGRRCFPPVRPPCPLLIATRKQLYARYRLLR